MTLKGNVKQYVGTAMVIQTEFDCLFKAMGPLWLEKLMAYIKKLIN